ncbi:FadR/GntR family transcriptional regulator [Streptomyces sp. NPDC004539]|uniref:FadR/GntR family transcriptional regulator n=1 Tax=Streptomyces sp. NPDC004539 TaxID=3154280 RepID=UPI0033AD18A2
MPDAEPRSAVPKFGTLTVPKASDVLAAEVRERILSGELSEGTLLPAERQFVEQTGLSRATVREALRVLEAERLVEIRPGRGGGAFVQRPGRESVAGAVQLVIRGQCIRPDALHETREAVEPACAALAAVHRTDADLAELDAAYRELTSAGSDVARFLRADVHWHDAVARAGRNELLIGFVSALSEAIHAATGLEPFLDTGTREATVRAHAGVTEAIRAGDAEAARRRMSRHVCGLARVGGSTHGSSPNDGSANEN